MSPAPIALFPSLVEPPYMGRGPRPRAQAAVLHAVRAGGSPLVARDLAGPSGRSIAGVRRCLRILARAGLVLKAGSFEAGRGRAWSAA